MYISFTEVPKMKVIVEKRAREDIGQERKSLRGMEKEDLSLGGSSKFPVKF